MHGLLLRLLHRYRQQLVDLSALVFVGGSYSPRVFSADLNGFSFGCLEFPLLLASSHVSMVFISQPSLAPARQFHLSSSLQKGELLNC